ncbi:MAG: thiamine-phosphate kinase [Flammeovirgaceae bacterium]|nr:thiamine-phosphate kinase [Flammeovirgaceae bacterium]
MEKRTELEKLGEFGLIKKIKNSVQIYNDSTYCGIGDDAAVINSGELQTIVSTDMLLEGVHFDLSYTPLKHLGYKAVAVNVSDIAAMNAIPEQITVNIGLSNRFSQEAVDEIYEGINIACKNYKVDLIGGDTTSSRSGLVISITAIGKARKEEITYRNTAKKGDIICATGDLGAAYLGLQILEREKQEYLANPEMQPDLEKNEYLVMRQLKPEARMDVIFDLRELKLKPTSMIDISDGLASELLHLTKGAVLGAVIYEDKLPVEQNTARVASEEFNLSLATCMLNGGEDYELLFTVDQGDFEKIKNHPDISFIGYMQEADKGVKMVTRAEQVVDITAQGFKHF